MREERESVEETRGVRGTKGEKGGSGRGAGGTMEDKRERWIEEEGRLERMRKDDRWSERGKGGETSRVGGGRDGGKKGVME